MMMLSSVVLNLLMLKLWTLLTLCIPETMISVRGLGKLWVFDASWLTCNGMKHRCCPQPNWRNKTVICDCFSPEDLGTALSLLRDVWIACHLLVVCRTAAGMC